MSEMSAQEFAQRDFRRVLGHYPTGVAVVTARPGGDPVGMVVGTFTSISLDPPLVGFLPARSSATAGQIRSAGSFCVNVLSSDQEQVCRAFVNKAADRFERFAAGDAGSGSPLLAGAALWVDCDLESVTSVGDHDLFVGRVRELALSDGAGLPLLFLRGGYGEPTLSSIQVEGPAFAAQIRSADLVRPEAERVAADLGLECLVSTVIDGSVVELLAAGIGLTSKGSQTAVGLSFPYAAPMAPVFAAWGTDSERKAWVDRGKHLNDDFDTAIGEATLDAVHRLGYQVMTGHKAYQRWFQGLAGIADRTGVLEAVRDKQAQGVDPGLVKPFEELTDVVALAAPIFDGEGRVRLVMHTTGFDGSESPEHLRRALARLLEGTERASALLSA